MGCGYKDEYHQARGNNLIFRRKIITSSNIYNTILHLNIHITFNQKSIHIIFNHKLIHHIIESNLQIKMIGFFG